MAGPLDQVVGWPSSIVLLAFAVIYLCAFAFVFGSGGKWRFSAAPCSL